jgi:predicted small secreted protein
MPMKRWRLATLALAAATLVAAACNRDDGKGGPGERAGRQVDRALDKAGQAVEKAGRDMQKSSKGDDSSQK